MPSATVASGMVPTVAGGARVEPRLPPAARAVMPALPVTGVARAGFSGPTRITPPWAGSDRSVMILADSG